MIFKKVHKPNTLIVGNCGDMYKVLSYNKKNKEYTVERILYVYPYTRGISKRVMNKGYKISSLTDIVREMSSD